MKSNQVKLNRTALKKSVWTKKFNLFDHVAIFNSACHCDDLAELLTVMQDSPSQAPDHKSSKSKSLSSGFKSDD